ncbi:MAG: exodeoxyribonuclease VII small subunit [Verrucomicrobiae bacterium]|nr:exodeoxyribonuclease VII small subunit [Verrucomicrobiae bacterium]MDW8310204.1 exodeoxyribonuclease VII small subunit [Verrucomicrobiales bacterium]
MSKTARSDASKDATLPFEKALERLEQVVETMEGQDLPLEELVAKYEEGMKLARACQAKLAEAELKLQQLEQNAAGELQLKPARVENES